jgi:6-phosphogluconate dehydrogenase
MTLKTIRRFCIVGLGKMGAGLALNALRRGFEVVGIDPKGAAEELTRSGLNSASVPELRRLLSRPRFVMLYVPAGPLVDTLLARLGEHLEPGDIIADGGNSYWGDSIRRNARAKEQELHFIDVGTSGGPGGALTGACFMVGGEREAVAAIEPILRRLAIEGGYIHADGPGAGHFVKLVHNGIEFGVLQVAPGANVPTAGRAAVSARLRRGYRRGELACR